MEIFFRVLHNAWNRLHLLNQQITREHMSTNCNDAYGIIQISPSTPPPLCTVEEDEDYEVPERTENNVRDYVNLQILSNDAREHALAAMTECDTTVCTEEPSQDEEQSGLEYEYVNTALETEVMTSSYK